MSFLNNIKDVIIERVAGTGGEAIAKGINSAFITIGDFTGFLRMG